MHFTSNETGFGWVDYVVFSVLCLISCAGGIWYAYLGLRKDKIVDVRDYLLGGKSMTTFPVALSLISSYVSGVTILGTPAEIYNYGCQYYLILIAIAVGCGCIAYVYLPVFCTLKLSSSYEYLELRFSRHIRAVASILFVLDEVLFLPIVVYVPSLAFNQLTGLNEFAVAGLMVLVCGLYTVLGGLRAVVWTDSVQAALIFMGVLAAAVAGTISAGGISTVFRNARRANRLDFKNWNFSPLERQTGWGVVFGGFVYWTCYNSVNQTMVQRYISLPTKRKAVIALFIFCVGMMLVITLCVQCGLAAFSAFVMGGCDANAAPIVDDRMLPAFVVWTSKVKNLPGLSGVFLSGVFGASLSTMSAVLNACALVAVEDLLRGWLQLHLKPLTEGIVARLFSAALAIISIAMLFVVRELGGVLGVATALSAIAASTVCGLFTLGMVCWWVGPRGALLGGLAGAITSGTIAFGSQWAAAQGLREPPISFADACPAKVKPASSNSDFDPTTVFVLFRISFLWIAPLGFLTTVSVGAIVGWFWDRRYTLNKMDAELFTPIVWRFLPQEYHDHAGDTRKQYAQAQAERAARMLSPPTVDTGEDVQVNTGETSTNKQAPPDW